MENSALTPVLRIALVGDYNADVIAHQAIPLALDAGVRDGKIKPGDTLMLEGVGGGFTWGAVLLDL